MGIQGQAALLFKSKEVGFDDIVYAIEHLYAERHRSKLTIRARPKVTVDSSLIAYKFLESSLHPSDGVSLICRALANRNIDVLIICDPPTRHHSKRAHHQRVGKKEKARLQLMLSRMELSHIQSNEKEKIEQLTNNIRKMEKAEGRCFLPSNFMERLQLLVSEHASQGKGEISIEVAPFQADPSIANAALLGECEAILSGDSDFSMYVGPGGPDNLGDIMLRDIKIHLKQSTITSCTFVTGQRKVATFIDGILSTRGLTNVFPIEPKFPLFNNVCNPKIRALIGVSLGCDVLPGGVPGLGASSLNNILSTIDLEADGATVDLATKLGTVKKAQLKDTQALLCIANSLVYERTTSELGYMFETPAILEKYNEAFASPVTRVVDGPTVLECKGCDGQCHSFLEAEGEETCVTCKATLCRFCVWLSSGNVDNSGPTCFDCKRYSIAGEDDQKTEQDMRIFLKSHAVNVAATATYTEVLKLFRDFNEDEHDIFGEDIKHIRYPLLPASSLNQLHESSKVINKIATVKVCEIGGLLKYDVETATSLLPAATVLRLVHLLASLTDIQQRDPKEKLSFRHAIPSNLINMATNARIHTSKRLCERALRHATDCSTPNIQNGLFTIGYFEDDVCVIIEQRVRASMKNVEYAAKAAITQTHFVAAVCNCRAGCSNEASPGVAAADVGQGKIICSHGMTLPVSLSLALYQGLATSVLIELRRRFQRENFEDIFHAEEIKLLRKDISSLMKATNTLATAMDTTKSILQCLDVFSVGTDSAKKPPSAPNPHDLGLLRDKCRYAKSTKIAEGIVTLKDEEMEIVDLDADFDGAITDGNMCEEYAAGQMAVDALSLVFGTDELATLNNNNHKHKVPVGLELLRDRAQSTQSLLDYSDRNKATAEVAERWKTALFQWASERSSGRRNHKFESAPSSINESVRKKKKISFSFSNTTRRPHKYCYIVGCSGNDINTKLIRVPNIPKKLPSKASRSRQITYRLKQFIRRECMDRLGAGRLSKDKDVRVCEEHWEEVTGMPSISVDVCEKNRSTTTENIPVPTFLAPRMLGQHAFASPPTSLSRGNAFDRATLRHVMAISNNEHALAHQQIVEMADVEHGDQQLSQINPAVRNAAGLNVHTGSWDRDADYDGDTPSHDDDSWREPIFTVKDLVPKEMKRLTGFDDLRMMLSFASMVCGGDLTTMTRTCSMLTWLEEWMLYFQFVWSRTIVRYEDYEKQYRCREKSLRKVVRSKVDIVRAARSRWPIYASYAEDAKFRGEHWSAHFDPVKGHRVVMHDSTNIPLARPSSAALQRALYNSYYGMCCAKAGVAVQLCGWIHGLPLNTGHSDDTRFIEDTEILQIQQIFAENDKSSTKPFLNIFDKGYQCTLLASKLGQFCLQPTFAESAKQFKDSEVLFSGAVAVVRSGNERAVNRCKMSWFLQRGAVQQMWDIDFVCDIWEAWTFQVNFMFEKFL